MAKARPVLGLGEDDPYAAVAASVLATRARELADHAPGVLDTDDIERVHDMRVATRRLRAALEVFEPCFTNRHVKPVLREVKGLADALGERRDRDVTIQTLSEFATGISQADRPGVQSLIARLRVEQGEANLALAPFVSEQRLAALAERLDELVREAEALVPAADPLPEPGPEPDPEPEPGHEGELEPRPGELAEAAAGNGAGVGAGGDGATAA
jgi:CHAD domain-containing protein